MRKLLIVVSLLFIGFVSHAQYFKGFFAPKPSPFYQTQQQKIAFHFTADSSAVTENFFRPVVNVSASVSNGASLTSGVGISYQHDKYDFGSSTWVVQYGFAALGWLGTNGSKITGTLGGVVQIPGTAGLVGLGAGYDLTNKVPVLITGVNINF